MTSWIKCMPPEMQVTHTEPTKTKSWSGELREKETLVQSLLKSTKVWLVSVAFGSLSNSGALHAGKVDNTAEPPEITQKDLCPFAATQTFSSQSACLHPCLLSWACKHLPTSLPAERNPCKGFNDMSSWGKRQISSSWHQTECGWSHWKQQKGNHKTTGLDLLAAHPPFEQNRFLLHTARSFLAH